MVDFRALFRLPQVQAPTTSELIRQMYDVPVYRGSQRPDATARGGWWAADPAEANKYLNGNWNPYDYEHSAGSIIPGQLNTDGFVSIDAGGAFYDSIPSRAIKDNNVRQYLQQKYKMSDLEFQRAEFKTDTIAEAIDVLGLPGVTFSNAQDVLSHPSTQYYVADRRRRRSRFARFEDPNSEDLMAGLLMSIMGVGASTQQGEENGS